MIRPAEALDDTRKDEPLWALSASPERVAAIDLALRQRLSDSLDYVAEVLDTPDGAATAEGLRKRLSQSPVSPWVLGLYSKAVAELSKDRRGEAMQMLDQIVAAAQGPAADGVIALGDPALPRGWWDHFQVLFDSDPERPFQAAAPSETALATCRADVADGIAVLDRGWPQMGEEVRRHLRTIVLGSPGVGRPGFNGASTFFLWGAALINADVRRSAVSMADLLVHESSHGILFGATFGEPLAHNPGEQRFASPLRSDVRPIDGIFHACYVASRVHLGMSEMLNRGALADAEADEAVERRDRSETAARTALDTLHRHAALTESGQRVIATIQDYWSDPARARAD